jgi:asparagine synthase (glutamine-hydrolysing)
MSSFECFYGIKSKKILIKEDNKIDPFLYDNEDEEPNFIVNRYFDIRILKECSKDGHSIIFDGFDGDSIISYGINHLYDLGKNFKIKELLRQKKILEETGEKKNNNTLKFLIKYMILPNLPLPIFNLLNHLRGVEDSEVIGHRLLSKDTAKNYPLEYLNNKFQIKKYSYLKSEEIHKKVIEWPIWDQILEINFRDSNKYDVEEVFPFLDKEVISLAINIPTEYKLKNGYKRFILREALKDILPEDIYKRTRKSDLSPAIVNYFKKLKKEKKYEELLLGQYSPLEGLIEKKKVREIYNNGSRKDNQILMKLISLARWMERYKLTWKKS